MAGPKRTRSKRDDIELVWRAVVAWARYLRPGQPRPSFDDTDAKVIDVDERTYVVVTSGRVQLAVFRLRSDGQLKRMRRPPRELRGDDE